MKYAAISLLLLPAIIGMYFPILGATLPLFYLIISVKFNSFTRIYLAVTSAFFSSVIISSRAIGLSLADDFSSGYWPLFIDISSGNHDKVFHYGDGFEPGLGFLFLIISYLFNEITPPFLIFISTFTNLILLIFCVEFILLKSSPIVANNKELTISLTLFFFSTFMTSQVMRQSFASVFLMMAIFSRSAFTSYLYLLFGTVFHLTTPLLYLFIKLSQTKPKLIITIVAIFGILLNSGARSLIELILKYLDDGIGTSKFLFYQDIELNSSLLDNGIFMIFQLSIFLILFIINTRPTPEQISSRNIYITFIALFVSLYSLPLASLRTTLFLNSVAFGYFAICAIHQRYILLFKYGIFCYMIFYFFFKYYLSNPFDLFRLWYNFDSYGSFAYFLQNY